MFSPRTIAVLLLAACSDTPPTATPPPQPSAAALPASTEEQPAAPAYAPPADAAVQLMRKRKRVIARFHWQPVSGATEYQLQVGRTLTFARTIVDIRVRQPEHLSLEITEGVYFWRVRALGPDAEGAFAPVQVIEISKRKQRTGGIGARPRREEPRGKRRPSAKDAAVAEELRLEWHAPNAGAVVQSHPIRVTGWVTPGAEVRVGSGPSTVAQGDFSLTVPLTEGRNELTLSATWRGQTQTLSRSVTFVNTAGLAPVRQRFEALQRELRQIEALRADLTATVTELRAAIDKAGSRGAAEELQQQLQQSQDMLREVEGEIGKILGQLDTLTGSLQ